LFFQQRTPRDDAVSAVFFVLDDPECVDTPDVLRRIHGPDNVDLGEWAEGSLTADARLVSALYLAFDPALHRQSGVERVFELPVGRRTAGQPPGKSQPSLGRHDHRLDVVADGDLERAFVVLQFGNVDYGLALAADVDKCYLRADRHDRALDVLTLLDALRLNRSLKHRGEVFIGFAHGVLLVIVIET